MALNWLSRETDRIEYAEYVLTGRIFMGGYSEKAARNPTLIPAGRSEDDDARNIFAISRLETLEKCADGLSLFEALEGHYVKRVSNLKHLVRSGRLTCEFHRRRVTMKRGDPAADLIRKLGNYEYLVTSSVRQNVC